ncbi:response regulator transcription factor [Terracoccus luteus]|uniref:LuxR family two component transcriptional regulator n=1 Tax=Terracoccus luteus TaxID=53356 RepID=A0A495Y2D1_9MICO|nr:response regulator transcription factor [Terracoccus luteus]MBB2987459.1 two-component system response regulator DesR [Terracoccus luteus]MCP2173110.1 two-component system response regulator DesR [Terracoccus luteus]RKT79859.1 LuxR family two component transcriptional regulator [Terracoccus luteus]
MSDPLRILIAEDVDLVAEAFAALLGTEPGFEVVARVGRGDEVAAAAERTNPDVALLDVDMPGATGIEATAQLSRVRPDCKVLLLTSLPGSGHIPRALAAGASGYVVKSMSATQLIDAIRSVASGRTVIDPQLAADALRSGPSPLTEREVQLLRLVDRGLDTETIAREMFLTKGTVRNYLSTVMTKMDVTTRGQAVATARGHGWL